MLAEQPDKVGRVFKVKPVGDFCNGKVRVGQQFFGFADDPVLYVAFGTRPDLLHW